jgi:hypothetical protein
LTALPRTHRYRLTLSVDEAVIRRAAALRLADFESAVVAAAAEAASCHAIVSRNPGDFAKSPVLVLTPKVALAFLQAEPETR